jgi:hypothetical protein
MSDLELVKRRVLSALEEAGENDLLSLLNTLRKSPSMDELRELAGAVRELWEAGLLFVSASREQSSREWQPLPLRNADEALNLDRQAYWSDRHGHWLWKEPNRHLEVVLTDAGFDAATKIVEQDGWTA